MSGEPMTCCDVVVELRGFEPLTPCMPSRNPGRWSTTKPCVASRLTRAMLGTCG
jgi:hypothetical protein